jgi:UDP-N-acetyl-D-glucosamine dehydrogenase
VKSVKLSVAAPKECANCEQSPASVGTRSITSATGQPGEVTRPARRRNLTVHGGSDCALCGFYRFSPLDRALIPIPKKAATPVVAVVGMGYVGLPTAVALHDSGAAVIGLDVSEHRLSTIRQHTAELLDHELDQLRAAIPHGSDTERFRLTSSAGSLFEADVIVIAVPTGIRADFTPDLSHLTTAVETVVAHARAGQTIILTSTTYVGCTRDMLVKPLIAAGFTVGSDIFVAFAPERIDPGNTVFPQSAVPRILGAYDPESLSHAKRVLDLICPLVRTVSSLEAAEMTKLIENTYRAVNIAWINEMADAAQGLGLDIAEVVAAASTKPYGFTAFTPGPGVGGHCIPCDPHYLLATTPEGGATVTAAAMRGIHERPGLMVQAIISRLREDDIDIAGAAVVMAGISYKPNVEDVRESPALVIMAELRSRGAQVSFFDPHVSHVNIDGTTLHGVGAESLPTADLLVWHTPHARMDPSVVLRDVPRVLDMTYRLSSSDSHVSRP